MYLEVKSISKLGPLRGIPSIIASPCPKSILTSKGFIISSYTLKVEFLDICLERGLYNFKIQLLLSILAFTTSVLFPPLNPKFISFM